MTEPGRRRRPTMDINLGPWTAAKTLDAKQRQTLPDAMGDEAWNTVKKKDGFTPIKVEGVTPAKSGFTISGQVVQVAKQGIKLQVKLMFTLLRINSTDINIVIIFRLVNKPYMPIKNRAVLTIKIWLNGTWLICLPVLFLSKWQCSRSWPPATRY